MAKELRCYSCNRYMGEVRDGTLSKDLTVLCGPCRIGYSVTQYQAEPPKVKEKVMDTLDHFMDKIFGKPN